jgi:hypothetical protein
VVTGQGLVFLPLGLKINPSRHQKTHLFRPGKRGISVKSIFFNSYSPLPDLAEFGRSLAPGDGVKQLNKHGETTMAMEKKSLVSKKPATPAKNKSKKPVDTSKPATSKVVAAKMMQ